MSPQSVNIFVLLFLKLKHKKYSLDKMKYKNIEVQKHPYLLRIVQLKIAC